MANFVAIMSTCSEVLTENMLNILKDVLGAIKTDSQQSRLEEFQNLCPEEMLLLLLVYSLNKREFDLSILLLTLHSKLGYGEFDLGKYSFEIPNKVVSEAFSYAEGLNKSALVKVPEIFLNSLAKHLHKPEAAAACS